ncbi:MAG: hypothetical protein HUK22_06025 [Thermoguttaceae bacterium]|nr:hypothetical protein [Thermoguttaceae bacterium]
MNVLPIETVEVTMQDENAQEAYALAMAALGRLANYVQDGAWAVYYAAVETEAARERLGDAAAPDAQVIANAFADVAQELAARASAIAANARFNQVHRLDVSKD